jgi:hypothetical protein
MAKRNLLLTLPLLAIIFTSCERYRCVEGNGNRITETRTTGMFYGVVSSSECDVFITIDTSLTEPEVRIEADENVLPYIQTTLRSQDLEISTRNNKCLETDLPVYVDIYMPSLDFVKLEGSGEIRCDDMSAENLRIDLTGSGKILMQSVDCGYIDVNHTGSGMIEITGLADESSFLLSGSGTIIADQLRQYNCFVDFPGSGTIYVKALEKLSGELSGSGVIYYYRPHYLDIDITGSGYIEEL